MTDREKLIELIGQEKKQKRHLQQEIKTVQ